MRRASCVPQWRFTRELREEATALVGELRPPAKTVLLRHRDAQAFLKEGAWPAVTLPVQLTVDRASVTARLRHPSLPLVAWSRPDSLTWFWAAPARGWDLTGRLERSEDWDAFCAKATAIEVRLRRMLSSIYEQPLN